ncbi:TonB family protein [Stenotrophomonas sp. AN71]|uniref:energy transducer TonB n=1 Tax=Stenotrophomonas sp. AN71 TaxID=3156253 RepID=UPI003D1E7DCF
MASVALLCVASAAAAYEDPPTVGISSMANNPARFPAGVYKKVPPGRKSLLLEIQVDALGKWTSTKVIESSGWDAIDAGYLKAGQRWDYQAAVRDGERVAGVMRLPVSFCLVACEPAPAKASAEQAVSEPQDAPAELDLSSRYGNAPIYPGQAYRDGLEGEAIVVCHVAADGTLVDALVETSSGWAVLDEAALVAVKKWRYTAARKNGVPVPGQVRIPVRFKQP